MKMLKQSILIVVVIFQIIYLTYSEKVAEEPLTSDIPPLRSKGNATEEEVEEVVVSRVVEEDGIEVEIPEDSSGMDMDEDMELPEDPEDLFKDVDFDKLRELLFKDTNLKDLFDKDMDWGNLDGMLKDFGGMGSGEESDADDFEEDEKAEESVGEEPDVKTEL